MCGQRVDGRWRVVGTIRVCCSCDTNRRDFVGCRSFAADLLDFSSREWLTRSKTSQEHLDQRLQLRRARDSGICTVREELYAQTFGQLTQMQAAPTRTILTIVRETVCAEQPISHKTSFWFADELIRQVTIECAERGLLFLRIRDESRK